MSRENLENSNALPRQAADRLLTLLKTRGPQTASELGAALGTTGEAARQQSVKLAAEGLVEARSESRGVGRPSQVWHLTSAGNARFPDRHAELTAQLIRTIRSELGEDALDRLISAREAEARESYAAALKGARDLEERISRLVAIRSREGYMAEWWADGVGYMLVENHCPICVAATACQGFCHAELDLFQQALGVEATVSRVEHILEGSRRCAYRITPAVPSRTTAKKRPPRRT